MICLSALMFIALYSVFIGVLTSGTIFVSGRMITHTMNGPSSKLRQVTIQPESSRSVHVWCSKTRVIHHQLDDQ